MNGHDQSYLRRYILSSVSHLKYKKKLHVRQCQPENIQHHAQHASLASEFMFYNEIQNILDV